MKAYVVNSFGSSGGGYASVKEPKAGPGEILIKICAAGLNPLDKMVQDGNFRFLLPYKTPFVLGHDLAGVVVGKGAGVESFDLGDEVFARPRDLHIGTLAEYIAVHADDVARKPTNLTMEEAASTPLVALAAWQILTEHASIKAGQNVLVHAGAGGLGGTLVQLARELGATVSATVSSGDLEKVRELGASKAIDYTKEDFASQSTQYDLVIDSIGGENLKKSMQVVKRGGKVLSVVGPPDTKFAAQLGKSYLKPMMYILSFQMNRLARQKGIDYSFFFMRANGSQLQKIAGLYESKKLRPTVDKVFSFDEVAEAMAYLRSGRARGKVVVSIAGVAHR